MHKKQLSKLSKLFISIITFILLAIGVWALLVHILHPKRVLGTVTVNHYKIEVIADVEKGNYCYDEFVYVTNKNDGVTSSFVTDAFGGTGGPCGHFPSSYWIYAEDFNKDGKPDFAVNNPFPNAGQATNYVKFIHGDGDIDNPFIIRD